MKVGGKGDDEEEWGKEGDDEEEWGGKKRDGGKEKRGQRT